MTLRDKNLTTHILIIRFSFMTASKMHQPRSFFHKSKTCQKVASNVETSIMKPKRTPVPELRPDLSISEPDCGPWPAGQQDALKAPPQILRLFSGRSSGCGNTVVAALRDSLSLSEKRLSGRSQGSYGSWPIFIRLSYFHCDSHG